MIFDSLLDVFRGKAITIPPLDGPLKANTALDEAEVALTAAAPDNLCSYRGGLLCSTGNSLLFAEGGGAASRELAQFRAPVSALAVSATGEIAVGLDDGALALIRADGTRQDLAPPEGLACPVAITFGSDGALFIAQGSARNRPSDWALDLMQGNASGSVWRLDLQGKAAVCLAKDLAFPYGLLVQENGGAVVVAESWRHRLVRLRAGAAPEPILTKLPAYPARLASTRDGGAWLALFAPRNRLIEFTLLEDAYRMEMLREVPREFWIAPALASGVSFLEPLQCGGVKTMGIHKPWSPSRSYGLVVKLDAKLRPVTSFHSRANGRRHGVTSVVAAAGRVFAAATGGDVVLDLGPDSADGA